MRTFRQVSQNFALVFKELVPEGKGSLVMVRDALAAGGSPPSQDNEVSTFRGVTIKVRACVCACLVCAMCVNRRRVHMPCGGHLGGCRVACDSLAPVL